MSAKVISGQVFNVKGPIVARTPTYYIDFTFHKAGEVYEHVIPKGWNSMFVLFKGSISAQDDDSVLEATHGIVFKANNNEDEIVKITTHKDNTRLLLLAGQPLNEPIANQGPFVLTNREQLNQAIDDF